MQIKEVAVDKLIPYAKNSRTHSDQQVAQIAASIKEFGFRNPILVDGVGIIAGHGRLMAAQKLGLDKVPTIDCSDMTPSQKKAYIIADNKLALNAGWDTAMLTIEMQELEVEGFDLDLLGFDDKELNALLEPEIVDGLTDEDEVPELPEEPKSKLGDIYILGNHRLMCGDSTSIDAVEKMMDGDKASLVVTDPPWNVAYGTNLANNAQGYKQRTIMNDNFETTQEWEDFLSGFMSSYSFIESSNDAILAVNNSQEFLDGTYSNMNDLITGDIAGVSVATTVFGQDLIASGKAINLQTIATFGLPSNLLSTLQKNNCITSSVSLALIASNITVTELEQMLGNISAVTKEQERKIYGAFGIILGQDLKDVLVSLNCKTVGLESLADLLSPIKLFPNSYASLTVPVYNTVGGPANSKIYYPIYVNDGLNSQLRSPTAQNGVVN
jgi:hypothetical protein